MEKAENEQCFLIQIFSEFWGFWRLWIFVFSTIEKVFLHELQSFNLTLCVFNAKFLLTMYREQDNCPPDNCSRAIVPQDNCPPDNFPQDNCPSDKCPPKIATLEIVRQTISPWRIGAQTIAPQNSWLLICTPK